MLLRSTSDFEIPSQIIEKAELTVLEKKEADISALKIQRGFPFDSWAIELKGACRYTKSTRNTFSLIDSEDLPHKRYLIQGNKIEFPDGTPDKKVTFYYAGMGTGITGEVTISDEQAAIIRRRLIETYLGKTGQEDLTNNQSSNN